MGAVRLRPQKTNLPLNAIVSVIKSAMECEVSNSVKERLRVRASEGRYGAMTNCLPEKRKEQLVPKAGETIRQWKALAVLVALLVSIAAIVIWGEPITSLFGDPARVRAFVQEWGALGPVAIILLQVAQVLLAPVPGQVVGLASGYLFGAAMGTLYSWVGVVLGSAIAFWLAKAFGRPLVERLVSRERLERFDDYARRGGLFFFFLFFLFPFLPDDIACFVAGLTPLPIPSLVLVAALGRLPGIAVSSLVGANVFRLTIEGWALFIALLLIVAILFRRFQARMEEAIMEAVGRLR